MRIALIAIAGRKCYDGARQAVERGCVMVRKKRAAPGTSRAVPVDYASFLESLKERVRQAQTKAMLSVNRELIRLYWDIGRRIAERQG
jgi:hypothetical protein